MHRLLVCHVAARQVVSQSAAHTMTDPHLGYPPQSFVSYPPERARAVLNSLADDNAASDLVAAWRAADPEHGMEHQPIVLHAFYARVETAKSTRSAARARTSSSAVQSTTAAVTEATVCVRFGFEEVTQSTCKPRSSPRLEVIVNTSMFPGYDCEWAGRYLGAFRCCSHRAGFLTLSMLCLTAGLTHVPAHVVVTKVLRVAQAQLGPTSARISFGEGSFVGVVGRGEAKNERQLHLFSFACLATTTLAFNPDRAGSWTLLAFEMDPPSARAVALLLSAPPVVDLSVSPADSTAVTVAQHQQRQQQPLAGSTARGAGHDSTSALRDRTNLLSRYATQTPDAAPGGQKVRTV